MANIVSYCTKCGKQFTTDKLGRTICMQCKIDKEMGGKNNTSSNKPKRKPKGNGKKLKIALIVIASIAFLLTGGFLAFWYTANYASYKVEYYFENIDDESYFIDSGLTEKHSIKKEEYTSVEPRNIYGFTALDVIQKQVKESNTVIIKIYYSRNSYNVTFGEDTQTYKYGKTILFPNAPEKDGYKFLGWTTQENSNVPQFTPNTINTYTVQTQDITFYEIFSWREDIQYTINYFYQNIENNAYTLGQTSIMNDGSMDEVTDIHPEEVVGFTCRFNEITDQQVIMIDGSTTIDVFYDRNSYKVEFYTAENEIYYSENLKYGATINLPSNPEKLGKTFVKWLGLQETVPNYNLVINAKWVDFYTKGLVFTALNSVGEIAGINDSVHSYMVGNLEGDLGYDTAIITQKTDIIIPANYNDKPVVKIGKNAFLNCQLIESVFWGENVTHIGDGAFKNSSLTEIIDFNNVKFVGIECFKNTKLTSLDINTKLETIKKEAFADLKYVASLKFDANVSDFTNSCSVFANLGKNISKTAVLIGKNVTRLPNYFMSSSTINIDSITFEDRSLNITFGKNCFENSKVQTLVNMTNVISIEDNCFKNSNMTTFDFLENVSYGESIFENCSRLKILEIQNLSTIPQNFCKGSGLEELTLNDVEIINKEAFSDCVNLLNITFNDDKLVSLKESAFNNCRLLISINLGKNLLEIGENCFANTLSLETINVDDENNNFYDDNNSALYSLNTLILYASKNSANSYTILDSVNTSSITKIASMAFNECNNLNEIVLGENIDTLLVNSINNCKNLEKITILSKNISNYPLSGKVFNNIGQNKSTLTIQFGQNVENIQSGLLSDNTKITNIIFDDGVVDLTIGNLAFKGLTNLTEVEIPKNARILGSNILNNCNNIQTIYYNAIRCNDVNDSAFGTFGNELSGVKVVIGKNVQFLPANLFKNASNVSKIEIEANSSLQGIGNNAFNNTSITGELILPDTLENLGEYSFANCKKITAIDLSQTILTSIPSYCFAKCEKLETVNLPNTLQSIMAYAFNDCIINELELPDLCLTVKEFAFCNNVLTALDLGNCQTIGDYAFAYSKELVTLTLPVTITSIGNFAFNYAEKLATIVSNSVHYYSDGFGLYGNGGGLLLYAPLSTRLEYTIPSTVTLNSTSVTITYMQDYIFSNAENLTTLTIPNSIINLNAALSQTKHIEVVNFANSNQKFYSDGKAIYNSDGILIAFYKNSIDTYEVLSQIEINSTPITIKSIASNAFKGMQNIKNVTLATTIETINNYAFADCAALESITLKGKLYSIGVGAFQNCVALKNVNFDNIENNLIIKESAFSGCLSLEEITFPDKLSELGQKVFSDCISLKKVNFAENCIVTYINALTFSNCTSLTEFNIPSSITTIQNSAFSDCTNLRTIYVSSYRVANFNYQVFNAAQVIYIQSVISVENSSYIKSNFELDTSRTYTINDIEYSKWNKK